MMRDKNYPEEFFNKQFKKSKSKTDDRQKRILNFSTIVRKILGNEYVTILNEWQDFFV
jgi:hypothetical protein